jgi:uncharacterized protein
LSIYLLDVNVLVALTWPTHIHHLAARSWFDATGGAGWATCPVTQLGFVRVSSNPKQQKGKLATLDRGVASLLADRDQRLAGSS